MYCEVFGATVFGLSAYPVRVEVDAGPGLPCFEMSGYLNNEVREARERVKIAIKNSGFKINPQRIVINYSPADIQKHGTGLDLPTAIGLLGSNGFLNNEKLEYTNFMEEAGYIPKIFYDSKYIDIYAYKNYLKQNLKQNKMNIL